MHRIVVIKVLIYSKNVNISITQYLSKPAGGSWRDVCIRDHRTSSSSPNHATNRLATTRWI